MALTSRSGAETLKRRGPDFIAERILCYLQSLPDVTVCVEAVDAVSTEAMPTLSKNIDRPLGGCMLMTGLFSDGMFASHSKESFERPFASKTGAFITLESAVDLERLGFLVAFSSASVCRNITITIFDDTIEMYLPQPTMLFLFHQAF